MIRVGIPCSTQSSGDPCDPLSDVNARLTTLEQTVQNLSTTADGVLIVDVDPDFSLPENENITMWYNRTEEKLKIRDDCEIYAVTLTLDRDWCYYYG